MKTREEWLLDAEESLSAGETITGAAERNHPAYWQGKAIYFALRALSAPPAEPPTAKEDGAALALLVALVSEVGDCMARQYCDLTDDAYRIFLEAQTYVRTQAAKGEAGK